jgi:hypothetical protein
MYFEDLSPYQYDRRPGNPATQGSDGLGHRLHPQPLDRAALARSPVPVVLLSCYAAAPGALVTLVAANSQAMRSHSFSRVRVAFVELGSVESPREG